MSKALKFKLINSKPQVVPKLTAGYGGAREQNFFSKNKKLFNLKVDLKPEH